MSKFELETKCLQSGYTPKNGEPRVLPIYQSTTYRYESADLLGDLFDLKAPGHMYSRISNPTVDCVEKKIADLEGGTGAVLTSSGQAANLLAILNITSAGQNIVSLGSIYGGTVNLFAVTLKRLGIEVRFVDAAMSDEEIASHIDENTRLFFGETVANPALTVLDITRFALNALNIDTRGLDAIDNKILNTIIDKFNGGPVGAGTIATAISEDVGTLEEVYEPFLIKEGFLTRTPRGRVVTDLAYKHLGKNHPQYEQDLFS